MDSNESIDVQSVSLTEVNPEREPASPTAQTVSRHSIQPTQNNAGDISANSNEQLQTATANTTASRPISGQDHQTDNATRNSSSNNPSAQAATGAGSSSQQGNRRVLISEPPPPYPGPPLNPTFAPPNNTLPSSGNRFSSAGNQTGDPVFIFNPYGPTNHSFMIPVLPGQIQYADSYPNTSHRLSQAQLPSVMTPVFSQPPNTQETVRVHPTGIARQPLESDYLRLSFVMLVCCSLQANIPALFFILPAIFLSMKAHQDNERGRFRRARSFGYAALVCNVLAMVEYVAVIVGACIIFVLLYVVQIV